MALAYKVRPLVLTTLYVFLLSRKVIETQA